jgi:hypothetical protein
MHVMLGRFIRGLRRVMLLSREDVCCGFLINHIDTMDDTLLQLVNTERHNN